MLYVTKLFKFSIGSNILKYLRQYKDQLINKCVEKKTNKRVWHILFRPRKSELFDKNKILIRQTGNSIVAALDSEIGYYCIDSVNVALLKTEYAGMLKYFLGLLNSTLLNFYYQEISQEAGRALAQVKPQRIKMLPIAVATTKHQALIVKLVEEIIQNKTKNPDANTYELEQEIDKIVYEIYELTPEDIKLVKRFMEED